MAMRAMIAAIYQFVAVPRRTPMEVVVEVVIYDDMYIYIYKIIFIHDIYTYLSIYIYIISINGLIYIICTYCAEVPILVATRLPFLVPDRTHAIRVGHGNFIPVFRHETRDPSYGQHGNGVNPLTKPIGLGRLTIFPTMVPF